MPDSVFHVPARITFGVDVLNRLGVIASSYGTRALLVTEPNLRDAGHIRRVQDLLSKKGIDVILHDELLTGAQTGSMDEAIGLARAGKVQMVIGLGGMNAVLAARCASVAAPNQEASSASLLNGSPNPKTALPCIAIPTAIRDHFLFTEDVVLVDGSAKTARSVRLGPSSIREVLVDPRLNLSLSKKAVGAALLDTLSAACEGYLSKRNTFLSETLFLESCRAVHDAVDLIHRQSEDLRGRFRACEAGMACSIALSSSVQGPAGALTYAINAKYSIPKAWVATVLLPHMLDYAVAPRTDRLVKIAEALGEEADGLDINEDAARAASAVRRMMGRLGLTSRLRDFDIRLDDMFEMSEIAAGFEMSGYSPVAHSSEDIYEMVKAAF